MKRFFGIITCIAFATQANAMQCTIDVVPIQWRQAEFIFLGTIIEIEKLPMESAAMVGLKGDNCGAKVATFTVEMVWKGSFSSDSTKVFSWDSCYGLGSFFEEDSKYILFGNAAQSDDLNLVDLGACHTLNYELAKIIELDKYLTNYKEVRNRAELNQLRVLNAGYAPVQLV